MITIRFRTRRGSGMSRVKPEQMVSELEKHLRNRREATACTGDGVEVGWVWQDDREDLRWKIMWDTTVVRA